MYRTSDGHYVDYQWYRQIVFDQCKGEFTKAEIVQAYENIVYYAKQVYTMITYIKKLSVLTELSTSQCINIVTKKEQEHSITMYNKERHCLTKQEHVTIQRLVQNELNKHYKTDVTSITLKTKLVPRENSTLRNQYLTKFQRCFKNDDNELIYKSVY
jgi:uncharacterized protein YnzC (UPF0291/DUF896 family)